MKNQSDKVQTGLRIPVNRYEELLALADTMGVSINSLLLMLIDLGLSARNNTVLTPREQKSGR